MTLSLLQKFLRNMLHAKKDAFFNCGKLYKFDHLLIIFDILSRLPGCPDHIAAPMPNQDQDTEC